MGKGTESESSMLSFFSSTENDDAAVVGVVVDIVWNGSNSDSRREMRTEERTAGNTTTPGLWVDIPGVVGRSETRRGWLSGWNTKKTLPVSEQPPNEKEARSFVRRVSEK